MIWRISFGFWPLLKCLPCVCFLRWAQGIPPAAADGDGPLCLLPSGALLPPTPWSVQPAAAEQRHGAPPRGAAARRHDAGARGQRTRGVPRAAQNPTDAHVAPLHFHAAPGARGAQPGDWGTPGLAADLNQNSSDTLWNEQEKGTHQWCCRVAHQPIYQMMIFTCWISRGTRFSFRMSDSFLSTCF